MVVEGRASVVLGGKSGSIKGVIQVKHYMKLLSESSERKFTEFHFRTHLHGRKKHESSRPVQELAASNS